MGWWQQSQAVALLVHDARADLDAEATRFVESRERLRARMAARGETPVQV